MVMAYFQARVDVLKRSLASIITSAAGSDGRDDGEVMNPPTDSFSGDAR